MRAKSLALCAILGGLSPAYGCHTIAGVRTDGVLAKEDGGTASGGNGGAAGAGGMAGAGGNGGAAGMGGAGNCDPTNCLSNKCDKGACVPSNPICTESGTPFYIFVPTDFVNPDSKMLVGYSSKAAYVMVSDEGGLNPKFRVRSIDGDGTLDNIVDCTASSTSANMVSARATDTEFVLQGHLDSPAATSVEISFPTNDPYGKITGPCVEAPIPSWPDCVDRTETEVFVRNGNATKYVTTCGDAVDPNLWHLVTGGSDEPMYTEVASGPNTDISLRAIAMGFIKNERVIFSGPDLAGSIWHRRGAMAFAPQQIDFSGDPARQESLFGVIPEVEGQSAYIVGASAILPPSFDAFFMAGLVTDMNQFATAPPQGIKQLVHLGSAELAKLGKYGQIAKDDISYYASIIPLSKKSVDLYWFTKKGETLINGKTGYAVPMGDPSTITRVAFVPLVLQRLVVWREENGTQVTVRGQRYVCSY